MNFFKPTFNRLLVGVTLIPTATPNDTKDIKYYDHITQQTILTKATNTIANARNILVITGAGISADSGIPTYRSTISTTSSGEGIWNKAGIIKTMFYGSWIGWILNNKQAWKLYYKYYYKYSLNSKPNLGHIGLFRIYEFKQKNKNNNMTIITQNVDSLHQKSGILCKDIIEMHGNASNFKCNLFGHNMNHLMKSSDINENFIAPYCDKCMIAKARPNVVFFGERLKYSNITRVLDIIRNMNEKDVVLIIGTSLNVNPIAEWAQIAIDSDTPVIEINLEEHLNRNLKNVFLIDTDIPLKGIDIELKKQSNNNIFLKGNASVILQKIVALLNI